MISETAYAKINLALHVRERMPDGYHRLETLFAFAQDGDRLAAEPADTLSLTIDGPFAPGLSAGPDNLVMRAAERLRAASGATKGAKLHLTKNLPVASGIGGGSADAAAALRLLVRLWQIDFDQDWLRDIAGPLGADIPACVSSKTMRGEGRGDLLEKIDGEAITGMPLLLVNPGIPLATGPVFTAWNGIDRGPLPDGDPMTAALAGRNDLEEPAIGLVPQIGTLIEWLAARPGVRLARMSGSGATVFALFGEMPARDATATALAHGFPDSWCLATGFR